jgi:glycosyltransferase involved in cell wall biosynthesis
MISVVVLTHDSEATIKKTLESVSWCDEIIIVDDQSTDATVKIAKVFDAHIYTRPLEQNFAASRNFGLSKAKGDWVLFVDSDEVVSRDLQEEIKYALTNDSADAYAIQRMDWMWGRELKHGETAHIWLTRLARKGKGIWIRPVHEVWDVRGSIGKLANPLHHYPHPDVAQFLDQINMYTTVSAADLYAQRAPSYGWHVVVYPVAKFIKNYIILGGFLDGMPGFIFAFMMSFHSFLNRGKLYMLYNRKKTPIPQAI